MKTLALRNDNWDLTIDDFGNIAVKESNNQLAQDVASSVRVFLGEMEFDKNRGVSYNKPEQIRKTIKDDIKKQALLIDGVEEAVVVFEKIEDRKANVVIYVTNENGDKLTVGESLND